MRTMLTAIAAMAFATASIAQGEETKMKELSLADAKARTSQLVQELGLTEEQAAKVQEIMTNAEMSTVEDRMACKTIEARVESTYIQSYDEVASMLTPEQAAKLSTMRKEGTVSTKCCAPVSGSKAGCASEKAASKSGCCASKPTGQAASPSLQKNADDSKSH